MVHNVIHAVYSETYDLNTALGELSMLAFHTPQASALKSQYKGFFEQYKKFKILGCNFQIKCLSEQSLSPDQLGLQAGQVDPRDIANPLLFKAVTGEGLGVLLDQIYNDSTAINRLQVGSVAQHVDAREDALKAYYALFADTSWRRAHPQRGMTVMGLKPMVHKVVTTQPFKWSGVASASGELPRIAQSASAPDAASVARGFGGPCGTQDDTQPVNASIFVSDGVTEMPWLDTAVEVKKTLIDVSDEEYYQVVGNQKCYGMISSVPRVYMGVLILPPAILQRLFFRLEVVWHIAFKDFRPAFEIGPLASSVYQTPETIPSYNPNSTYFNLYHNAVPDGAKEFGSFSASENVEADVITEKVQ